MIPPNIRMFDRCVATVFAELYARFPIRTRISLSDWPARLFDDDDSVHDILKKGVIFEHTVTWLRDAGYIWAGDIGPKLAEGVVLTPQALHILKSTPASLEKSETLGEWIQHAVKNGAKDAIEKGVSLELTAGLGALVS